jgi:hypothetical protein
MTAAMINARRTRAPTTMPATAPPEREEATAEVPFGAEVADGPELEGDGLASDGVVAPPNVAEGVVAELVPDGAELSVGGREADEVEPGKEEPGETQPRGSAPGCVPTRRSDRHGCVKP